jgi:hypothetical protein
MCKYILTFDLACDLESGILKETDMAHPPVVVYNHLIFSTYPSTSVMRRNLQMDVLKEYKVVCCHNYVKYNNIQNKFSLLKLCSIVRINF